MESKNSKLICTMIDALGPIKWLDNNRIIGRQNFGEKNNLVIVEFVGGSELGECISTGLARQIDRIELHLEGQAARVASHRDGKLSMVNLVTRNIAFVKTIDYLELTTVDFVEHRSADVSMELVSPDGNKILRRIIDQSGIVDHLEVVKYVY